MAMEQPEEGSNSNTYRPVFALLHTHLWLSFFLSLPFIVCFENWRIDTPAPLISWVGTVSLQFCVYCWLVNYVHTFYGFSSVAFWCPHRHKLGGVVILLIKFGGTCKPWKQFDKSKDEMEQKCGFKAHSCQVSVCYIHCQWHCNPLSPFQWHL